MNQSSICKIVFFEICLQYEFGNNIYIMKKIIQPY